MEEKLVLLVLSTTGCSLEGCSSYPPSHRHVRRRGSLCASHQRFTPHLGLCKQRIRQSQRGTRGRATEAAASHADTGYGSRPEQPQLLRAAVGRLTPHRASACPGQWRARRLSRQSWSPCPAPASAAEDDFKYRAERQIPLMTSSTYRGIMLHRVADVQHFSRLRIHGALGSVPPRESWGRGGSGDGRGGKAAGIGSAGAGVGSARDAALGAGMGSAGDAALGAGTGSAGDAALATRVLLCVGFFAFFISLSSVN